MDAVKNGMLAQLVEQWTFNPFVVGSTPAHPTKLALAAEKPNQFTGWAFFTRALTVDRFQN